ncbi:MAG: proline--tRNA ligase [Chloroflexi bacterium]|nr:proline--tRNA ligase [Chloroflexota bacterium]
MRISQLLGRTLRQEPAEVETPSHRLMMKASLIAPLSAGVYSYLPLGWRALRKIEQVIREEMDAAGGQEVMMPVLQPIELWEETDRRRAFGPTLFTTTDRKERVLCLGPTHEEVVTLLVRRHVQSYRDLPLRLYQIQTKFRDEPRPRGGLMRTREFTMKDLYSFDAGEDGLEASYQAMMAAYYRIFQRCGLQAIAVEADSGAIGGKDSHEFMVVAESGENDIIFCTSGDYAANVERAQSVKPPIPLESPLPLEHISTPGVKTIEDLAHFLGIPQSRTLKAVFYMADASLVFVVIRGDLEVNEVKLKNALHCFELRLADDEEVAQAGLVAGWASPVGLKGVRAIADDSILLGSNFVAGGNSPDTHLRNANYPRDFSVEQVLDIATAQPGHACPRCGSGLRQTRGIEVGHVFKLGTFFSQRLGATYLDREGTQRPIIMGCYGIGVGRLLAAAIEAHHDDKGIIWPVSIAPYHIYLCPLNLDQAPVREAAESLYQELTQRGFEVLYDDRTDSPGIKFNDADLLGMPLRLTVSPRTLREGVVEVQSRQDGRRDYIPRENVVRLLGVRLRALARKTTGQGNAPRFGILSAPSKTR